ncbi:hypothetical protein OROHE_014231 [Orobanche hederae]
MGAGSSIRCSHFSVLTMCNCHLPDGDPDMNNKALGVYSRKNNNELITTRP